MKELTEFPKTSADRFKRHPFHKWLDGGIYQLTHGEDFETSVINFRCQVYIAARRLGKKVRVSIQGESLVIQAFTPEVKS